MMTNEQKILEAFVVIGDELLFDGTEEQWRDGGAVKIQSTLNLLKHTGLNWPYDRAVRFCLISLQYLIQEYEQLSPQPEIIPENQVENLRVQILKQLKKLKEASFKTQMVQMELGSHLESFMTFWHSLVRSDHFDNIRRHADGKDEN